MELDRITLWCFGASYAVALLLEGVQLRWRGRVPHWLALGIAAAGLAAHTLFLAIQSPPLASQFGSMLFLAWILAVFYLYGSLHHRRVAWGIFVLPLVLGAVVLAGFYDHPSASGPPGSLNGALGDLGMHQRFWIGLHSVLLLLAAVGVCVGFVASLMYLVQVHRLRSKALPGEGLRLLSLERLEAMNRRAIILAFPLLTAGVLVGLVLLLHRRDQLRLWPDPTILGTGLLWLVFAILLYLRYGYHLRGRRVAYLTIVAFGVLLVTLVSFHGGIQGGGR